MECMGHKPVVHVLPLRIVAFVELLLHQAGPSVLVLMADTPTLTPETSRMRECRYVNHHTSSSKGMAFRCF